MSTIARQYVIRDFVCDAEEFFAAVTEEVDRLEFPEVTYERKTEYEDEGGVFKGKSGEHAELKINAGFSAIGVIPVQVGRVCSIGVRLYYGNTDLMNMAKNNQLTTIQEMKIGAVQSVLVASVKRALKTRITEAGAPMPAGLNVDDLFDISE